jgi:outer membrane protein assembly factor BamB
MSYGKKIILPLIAFVVFFAATGYYLTTKKGKIFIVRMLVSESFVRKFDLPKKTDWKPEGVRTTAKVSETHGWQTTYARTIHTDTHSADEMPTAITPAFELDWIAEPTMFVPEGPVFDSDGNIYFSPVFPPENVILVSIEPEKGERRWVLEGLSGGAGTPFVYTDPVSGKDIIYVGTYDRNVALNTDGSIIYDRSSGLPKLIAEDIYGGNHSYGMSYHLQHDALVTVMGDGHLTVVDRETGVSLLKNPFQLPGDKTAVTNIKLPKEMLAKANKDFAYMYGSSGVSKDFDPLGEVFHALFGELQQVTNFFSIDKNTGRIWVAASLPDEEDGNPDGWSEFGALYGMDLVLEGGEYSIQIKHVIKFDGGTSSTPAISADGKRVYVADAFNHLHAVNTTTGKRDWSFEAPDLITGSLTVSSDNGEIYANIRNKVIQIIDHGYYATLGWTAEMEGFVPGRFQRNFKGLGAEVAANGVALTIAVGVIAGKQKLPFKLGAGLLDRKTGKLRYFADGAEDSVSSIVISPGGEIYFGNSPLRRIFARATFGNSVSPVKPMGGVTKFKPIHSELLIRDALWAAANRAANAATIVKQNLSAGKQDIAQINQLLAQSIATGPRAISEGNLSQSKWLSIETKIHQTQELLAPSESALIKCSKILEEVVDLIENI